MPYIAYNRVEVGYLHEIEFYEKENGKAPIEKFMNGLDEKMRTKALRELILLKEHGRDLREPHVKYMGEGIHELRIQTGSNISRIFYFFYSDNGIILTNGFIKKTKKTPPNELKKAIKYKKDHIRRHKK